MQKPNLPGNNSWQPPTPLCPLGIWRLSHGFQVPQSSSLHPSSLPPVLHTTFQHRPSGHHRLPSCNVKRSSHTHLYSNISRCLNLTLSEPSHPRLPYYGTLSVQRIHSAAVRSSAAVLLRHGVATASQSLSLRPFRCFRYQSSLSSLAPSPCELRAPDSCPPVVVISFPRFPAQPRLLSRRNYKDSILVNIQSMHTNMA